MPKSRGQSKVMRETKRKQIDPLLLSPNPDLVPYAVECDVPRPVGTLNTIPRESRS